MEKSVTYVYFRQCKKVTPLKHLILSLLTISSLTLSSQDIIEWYTWEEGMTKAEESPKKFVIDLYTDWCGWCKRMDKATFQNPQIASYINEHYIAIKFNAEQKEDVEYLGNKHSFVNRGRGYHSLAAQLTNGKLSYPTVVFLDEDKNVIQAIPGFLDAATFDPIMRYFAENLYEAKPWAAYLREYKEALGAPPAAPTKQNNHAKLVKGNK